MAKKYTVLVIPKGTNTVRRFSMPPWLVPFFFALLIAAIGMSIFWFREYQTVCKQLPDLKAMEQQNRHHSAQVKAFAKRLTDFKDEMKKLKEFNHRLRILANLEKPNENDGIFGMGGPDKSEHGPGIRLAHSDRDRQLSYMRQELDDLYAAGDAERQVQIELAKFLKERRSILASTPSIWPVKGWVTSGFGNRTSPFTGKKQFHAGIDISNKTGTPIVAPADGVVTYAGRRGSFGKMVMINHGHGLVTRYGHLSKFEVKVGQKVKRGQKIARVGNTGRSSGPHLHYEVLMSGVPTNPRYYILD